jgi:hypothetical protein
VDEWLLKCQALVQEKNPTHSLGIMEGNRWWRIVKERPDGRNVFGFVDATGDPARDEHLGDIRRADGWKRPAKLKTHLGNIFDEHGGMKCVTVGGPRPAKKGDMQRTLPEPATACSDERKSNLAWSLVDDYDDELPRVEIDSDGDLTSWEEARDVLIDALMGVVADAESRLEDAQDWEQEASEALASIEGMDQKAFLAAYGPELHAEDQPARGLCEARNPQTDAEEATTGESLPSDGRMPAEVTGQGTRTFRARWCGHVEIEAQSKEEAFDIHADMAAEDILKQLIFNGIEE